MWIEEHLPFLIVLFGIAGFFFQLRSHTERTTKWQEFATGEFETVKAKQDITNGRISKLELWQAEMKGEERERARGMDSRGGRHDA